MIVSSNRLGKLATLGLIVGGLFCASCNRKETPETTRAPKPAPTEQPSTQAQSRTRPDTQPDESAPPESGVRTPDTVRAQPNVDVPSLKHRRPHVSDEIFTNNVVLEIAIEIPRRDMELLATAQPQFTGAVRPVGRAVIREGDRVYTNVAVRVKGAAGSFKGIYDNPSLTLNFDKFAKGQLFHGLDKISLNNSVQDSSFLSEKICRELFAAAGVPVPRSGFATVNLNGRNLGLRVMTEGFGERFLKAYFNNTKGNLYDGGFCRDISDPLSTNSGAHPEDRSDLQGLATAARRRNFFRIQEVLDVDQFVSMLAMEVIQYHWDGYGLNRNNYRIYHDLDTGRMVFMPHGLDQMFGSGRNDLRSIYPQWNGLVAKAVMATSEGRRRYTERLTELLTNVFHARQINARVDELAACIRPAVANGSLSRKTSFDNQVASLKQRIAVRERTLILQTGTTPVPMKLEPSGVVPLARWQSRITRATEHPPELAELVVDDGKRVFEINIKSASFSSASWRTELNSLPPGRYRFEARAKYEGVTSDSGSGVALRKSGERQPQRVSGDSDWTTLAYEFDVLAPLGDVALVCELAAAQGRVWFEKDSLRLTRQ